MDLNRINCNCNLAVAAMADIAGKPRPRCDQHPPRPTPKRTTDKDMRKAFIRAVRNHASQHVEQERVLALNSSELADTIRGAKQVLPSEHDHKPFDA